VNFCAVVPEFEFYDALPNKRLVSKFFENLMNGETAAY
jgi:hypothetical protein